MSLEFFSIAIFIAVLSGLYLFLPWFEAESPRLSSSTLEFFNRYQNLVQNREILLENLKDLELDFRTEKVQEADYHLIRDKLLKAAVVETKQLNELEEQHSLFKWLQRETRPNGSS